MFSLKVLIILDLTVEQRGDEVGTKLGDPVNYDPNKNRAQQQQPQQRLPPSRPTSAVAAPGTSFSLFSIEKII